MLSRDLQRFISRNVTSVEGLEVLLLLFGRPELSWSAGELSAEFHSSLMSIERRLGDLAARQLVKADEAGRWRYHPDARHDARVEELRREYAVRPARVIYAIFSAPDSALESFADAFRLRAEDSDDR